MFPKKSLGQNFLVDLNVIKKITNLVNIKNKNIIEIGPGKGALTHQILIKKPKSVILIEKDNLLSQKLKEKYNKIKSIKIFNQDILNFDLEKVIKQDTIIFGNLPYNISSQILVKILKLKKWPPKYTSLIFMFQKEVAEKIYGKFKTTKYGRLSIIANYKLMIFKKFDISPNCFFPKPKVISTVLHLKPNNKKYVKLSSINNLEKITQILFSNKRKMINKNLNKLLSKEKINSISNLNLNLRPEAVSPDFYYKITNLYER